MFYLIDHRKTVYAEHSDRQTAYAAANAAGLAVAERDEDGLRLIGADPLVRHMLSSRVHVLAPLKTAIRAVISIFAQDKDEKRDYLDFALGHRGVPGWEQYRALGRLTRRTLLTQVAWIRAEHRATYVAVMGGRL